MVTVRKAPGGQPLRVLVTRAAEQAGDLTERLRDVGCEVIEVPLIAVVDPADGGEALHRGMAAAAEPDSPYDWIVVTSPNAAARSLPLLAHGVAVGIAAIGPGTATICRDLGLDVALVPERSVGEGLVEAFPVAPESRDRRVLLPRAEEARDVVAAGLRAKGWAVDVVIAYRTMARTPTAAELESAKRADVVLCASSSAARSLVAGFGRNGLPSRVVSIGPQTTQTLEELGVAVFATADPYTLDGLVACVEAIVRAPDAG